MCRPEHELTVLGWRRSRTFQILTFNSVKDAFETIVTITAYKNRNRSRPKIISSTTLRQYKQILPSFLFFMCIGFFSVAPRTLHPPCRHFKTYMHTMQRIFGNLVKLRTFHTVRNSLKENYSPPKWKKLIRKHTCFQLIQENWTYSIDSIFTGYMYTIGVITQHFFCYYLNLDTLLSSVDEVHFQEFNSQKSAGLVAPQSFNFSKISGTLQ